METWFQTSLESPVPLWPGSVISLTGKLFILIFCFRLFCYVLWFWFINSSSALSLFFTLGVKSVRMRWVPLSGCVFLIPTLSLTSTRTSLLVSQQYLCRVWSQETQVKCRTSLLICVIGCRFVTHISKSPLSHAKNGPASTQILSKGLIIISKDVEFSCCVLFFCYNWKNTPLFC